MATTQKKKTGQKLRATRGDKRGYVGKSMLCPNTKIHQHVLRLKGKIINPVK
jgi:hypothetical protein